MPKEMDERAHEYREEWVYNAMLQMSNWGVRTILRAVWMDINDYMGESDADFEEFLTRDKAAEDMMEEMKNAE